MSHTTRSAAILTGGRATRFGGRDKSALTVEGRTILQRQLDALAGVVDEVLIVGSAHDLVPGCGPLGGLHAALSAARGDGVFLVACDMPYLSGPFIAHLLSLAHGA